MTTQEQAVKYHDQLSEEGTKRVYELLDNALAAINNAECVFIYENVKNECDEELQYAWQKLYRIRNKFETKDSES